MVRVGGTIFRQSTNPPRSKTSSQNRAGAAAVAPVKGDLPQLYKDAQEVLYVISSVFPFKFFADKIIIRKNHLDVIRGIFFWSGTVTRVQIQDIRQVQLQYNPFFATMEILPQGPLEDIVHVAILWKKEAERAKRIISGLYECHLQHVELSHYPRKELLAYLEEIGKTRG